MKKTLLSLLIAFATLNSFSQIVSTLAGNSVAGSTDATGTTASFNNPQKVAVDAAGNAYVADRSNHKIRKITPTGVVSTFAGSGTAGSTDGTGTAASFNNPYGVAVDANGNVYVADASNHKIRKITPAGVVSTFAGSGTSGNTEGTGTAATFSSPYGVAVDANGNVYVADRSNNKIRKITSEGVVSTFAGSGTLGDADSFYGPSASFRYPVDIAVDADGNVYVADNQNSRIRKITPTGGVSKLSNSSNAAVSFSYPNGVTVDAGGNVYVSEGNSITMYTTAKTIIYLAGDYTTAGYTNASGATARFNAPQGLAADANGNLYVADRNNHSIRKITPTTLPVTLNTFTAKANGNHAVLQWQTHSELNNKGFAIYRSGDESKFVKIGDVSTTSMRTDEQSSGSTYTFTDKMPLNGNNYYKLVQVDNDGKTTELGIRSLVFGISSLHFQLYPTPATEKLNIVFGISKYQNLRLLDITGKVLQNHILTNSQSEIVLNVGKYPKGIYLVELKGGNGNHVVKISK